MITDADVAAFAEDGVVVLRSIVPPEVLAALADAVETLLDRPGERTIVASPDTDPGLFVEDFCRWQEFPSIAEAAIGSPVARAAAALLAAQHVRFHHDHVLVKRARTEQITPWHQDAPYYNVDGPGVSAWIPLDPVPEKAAMEFWAGSHLGPLRTPRTFLDNEAKWFPEGTLDEMPDIEADRSRYELRRWALDAGDAVFFHFQTIHSAPGFPFDHDRRVVSLRYVGDAARHAPRPWVTSPPFPGLADELGGGAPFDHPLFPIAWEASP